MIDIISKEDCQKILHRLHNGAPTTLSTYQITKFSPKVLGFMGDHFKLTIKYTLNNHHHEENFFLKTLPIANQNQKEYTQDSGIFQKEIHLYQNLLPDLQKIVAFGPKCFFVRPDCIVLEDLTQRGFKNDSKHNFRTWDQTRGLLKTLAGYHAAAVIYEENRGIKINERFHNEIKEASYSFIEGEPRQRWCVTVAKCVQDCLKILGAPDEIASKFNDFVVEELPEMLLPSKSFRNSLTHDDLWCNNILFNENSECVIVDFQMARYSPPAFDLYVALLLNLEEKVLELKLEELKEMYYDFFCLELQKHKLVPEVIYPKGEFLESFEFYKLAALTEAAMYGTAVFISDELSESVVADLEMTMEFSNRDRGKFIFKELRDNCLFKERFNGVLRPLIRVLENK